MDGLCLFIISNDVIIFVVVVRGFEFQQWKKKSNFIYNLEKNTIGPFQIQEEIQLVVIFNNLLQILWWL